MTTATAKTAKILAQRLFDEAVDRVGGGRAWLRLTPGQQIEQIAVSAFDEVKARYDAEHNAQPVIADVIAAQAVASLKLKLLPRHG